MSTPDPSADPPVDELRPVQRTAAHALVVDDAGAVLLVRASARSDLAGRWFLPGGGLRHGEHPRDGVLRELVEETGLRAGRVVPVPLTASADVLPMPYREVSLHTLRLVLAVPVDELRTADGRPVATGSGRDPVGTRPEADGSGGLARFVPPDELARLPLMPFVAEVLGLPVPEPPTPVRAERPEPLAVEAEPEPRPVDPALGPLDPPDPGTDPSVGPDVGPGVDPLTGPAATTALGLADGGEIPLPVQRPAAYAVLIDETPGPPDRWRILLSRLAGSRAPHRPQGTWTLPGGGIDHGEHPLAALEREIYEETGLPYTPGPMLDIGSRHFIGRAPSGRLEDFHALRLVYAGSVPIDVPPQVTEVDGSTEAAAWIPLAELDRLSVAPAVREALAVWTEQRHRPPDNASGR